MGASCRQIIDSANDGSEHSFVFANLDSAVRTENTHSSVEAYNPSSAINAPNPIAESCTPSALQRLGSHASGPKCSEHRDTRCLTYPEGFSEPVLATDEPDTASAIQEAHGTDLAPFEKASYLHTEKVKDATNSPNSSSRTHVPISSDTLDGQPADQMDNQVNIIAKPDHSLEDIENLAEAVSPDSLANGTNVVDRGLSHSPSSGEEPVDLGSPGALFQRREPTPWEEQLSWMSPMTLCCDLPTGNDIYERNYAPYTQAHGGVSRRLLRNRRQSQESQDRWQSQERQDRWPIIVGSQEIEELSAIF